MGASFAVGRAGADRLNRFQIEVARENGELSEQRLLVGDSRS